MKSSKLKSNFLMSQEDENNNIEIPYNGNNNISAAGTQETSIEFAKTQNTYNDMKKKLLCHYNHLDWNLTEKDISDHHLIPNPNKKVTLKTVTKSCVHGASEYLKKKLSYSSFTDYIEETFPFRVLFSLYNKKAFFSDLIAGISVGIAAIPMGMSYSMLCGLPPAHGLYANIFFPLFYMFFGSSNQVAVGTSALEATLAYEAIGKVIGFDASYTEWLNAAIGLNFMIGAVLILMYLFRLGVVANLLADPLLNGFTTGVAITIAATQLKNVFGIPAPRMNTTNTIFYIISHIMETNIFSLVIFTSGIIILYIFKKINQKYFKTVPLPGSLIMLTIFVLLHFVVDYEQLHVSIVGHIPAGLPTPMIFNFESKLIQPLLGQAILYAILYIVIHISIAKSLAVKQGLEIDINREFLATGMTGVLSSFFQCYPMSTSVSRSSIAHVIGAKTILYSIPNVAVVVLTTTLITPLLYYLPISALSAVIMFCASGMIHFEELFELLKLWSPDCLLWITSFAVTVLAGSMEGVVAGAIVAILWIIKKNAFPKIVILGRIPGTVIYKNIKRFPSAQQIPGCIILRFDSSLNFLNASKFEKAVIEAAQIRSKPRLNKTPPSHYPVSVIIVDGSSINDMDVTSIRMLKRLATQLHKADKILLFSNWKGPMRDFLDRNHFYDAVPLEHCFLTLHDAVCWSELFYINTSKVSTPNHNYMESSLNVTPNTLPMPIEVQSTGYQQKKWKVFRTDVSGSLSRDSQNVTPTKPSQNKHL